MPPHEPSLQSTRSVRSCGGFQAPVDPHNTAARQSLRVGSNSLVLALLSPFLVLSQANVQKTLLAVVVLDIPLQIGTHLFYREQDAALGALGGLGISITTIALTGLYLSWFVTAIRSEKHTGRRKLHFNAALTLYLAIAAISALFAEDVALSSFEFILFCETYLVYLYIANRVRMREQILFVVRLLLVGCVLEGALMLAARFVDMQAIMGTLSLKFQIDSDAAREGILRVGGTVGSPNTAAGYLAMVMVLAVSVIFAHFRGLKWLAIGAVALGGAALVYTYSRGGWLAFATGTIALCLIAMRGRRRSIAAPVLTIVVLTLLSLPFYSVICERLFGNDNGSAESRVPLMKLALRITEEHPVIGVGPNNFTVVMDRYLTAEFRHAFLYVVHNKFLLVLSETGLAGLMAYLAFLIGAMRRGWRTWKAQDRTLSPLALGLTTAIGGHMVQMSVELFRGRPVQQLLWVCAALLVAMHRICNSTANETALSNIT